MRFVFPAKFACCTFWSHGLKPLEDVPIPCETCVLYSLNSDFSMMGQYRGTNLLHRQFLFGPVEEVSGGRGALLIAHMENCVVSINRHLIVNTTPARLYLYPRHLREHALQREK